MVGCCSFQAAPTSDGFENLRGLWSCEKTMRECSPRTAIPIAQSDSRYQLFARLRVAFTYGCFRGS